MSHPTLAGFIIKRPWLKRWMQPLSEWYFDNAGYRKLGLRYGQRENAQYIRYDHPYGTPPICLLTARFYRSDDLIPEESDVVQLALKRLSPKEAYDRVYRMRRAFQVCHIYTRGGGHSD
jgi:ubiquinol-cytochrome c reductase subunit 7